MWRRGPPCSTAFFITATCSSAAREVGAPRQRRWRLVVRSERAGTRRGCSRPAEPMPARLRKTGQSGDHRLWRGVGYQQRGTEIKEEEPLINLLGDSVPKPLGFSAFAPEWLTSGAAVR